jgi:hypothetical protein
MCRCTWLVYPPGPGRQATTLAFQAPSFQVPQVLPSSTSAMPRTTRCRRYGEPPQGRQEQPASPGKNCQPASPIPLASIASIRFRLWCTSQARGPCRSCPILHPSTTWQFRPHRPVNLSLHVLSSFPPLALPAATNTHDTNPTLPSTVISSPGLSGVGHNPVVSCPHTPCRASFRRGELNRTRAPISTWKLLTDAPRSHTLPPSTTSERNSSSPEADPF